MLPRWAWLPKFLRGPEAPPTEPDLGLGEAVRLMQLELGERVQQVNNGGCGLFASLFSDELDRLNVRNSIVFLTEVEPIKLVGRATCLRYGHDVQNEEDKVNIAPYHAVVRVHNDDGSVRWVDGLAAYDREPTVDGKQLNSVEMDKGLMPTVLERGGWNEKFDRRRKGDETRRIVLKHMRRARPYVTKTNT